MFNVVNCYHLTVYRAVKHAPPCHWTNTPSLHQKQLFSWIFLYNYSFRDKDHKSLCFCRTAFRMLHFQKLSFSSSLKNLFYLPWGQQETTFHGLFHQWALLQLSRYNLSSYTDADSAAALCRWKELVEQWRRPHQAHITQTLAMLRTRGNWWLIWKDMTASTSSQVLRSIWVVCLLFWVRLHSLGWPRTAMQSRLVLNSGSFCLSSPMPASLALQVYTPCQAKQVLSVFLGSNLEPVDARKLYYHRESPLAFSYKEVAKERKTNHVATLLEYILV